jgi:hypothetical protein
MYLSKRFILHNHNGLLYILIISPLKQENKNYNNRNFFAAPLLEKINNPDSATG